MIDRSLGSASVFFGFLSGMISNRRRNDVVSMKTDYLTIPDNEELKSCRTLSEALTSALTRAFNAVKGQEDLPEEEEDDDDE